MGTTPTIAASFGHLPLGEPPDFSILDVQDQLFNEASDSETREENILSRLLIILNHLLTYNSILHPFQGKSIGTPETKFKVSSLTQEEQTHRSRKRIANALSHWHQRHFEAVSAELQTLYCLTKLCFLEPRLQSLLTEAGYPPRCTHGWASGFGPSCSPAPEAVHYAWLILEFVSHSKDRVALWLPIATFLAALCIWRNIKSNGDSRTYGSIKVLKLFRDELVTMPWPCCSVMIQTLDILS